MLTPPPGAAPVHGTANDVGGRWHVMRGLTSGMLVCACVVGRRLDGEGGGYEYEGEG